MYTILQEQLETAAQEKKAIEAKLATLETSKSAIHLRRLETKLSENQAAFEDYKRQSQQITDALERRFRDEMQQLQSGSDDTANVWREKHRAQQLEIDRLQATNQDLEYRHAEAMAELGKKHQEDMEALVCKCEAQEDEMDHQMQQIHTLLAQVEDLQNSLEAATRRLEERASSSSRKVSLEEPTRTDHRICEEKIQSQQLELEELHRRITELRTTHEVQMNRLANEKARELQELQKELKAVHDLLEKTKAEGQVCMNPPKWEKLYLIHGSISRSDLHHSPPNIKRRSISCMSNTRKLSMSRIVNWRTMHIASKLWRL